MSVVLLLALLLAPCCLVAAHCSPPALPDSYTTQYEATANMGQPSALWRYNMSYFSPLRQARKNSYSPDASGTYHLFRVLIMNDTSWWKVKYQSGVPYLCLHGNYDDVPNTYMPPEEWSGCSFLGNGSFQGEPVLRYSFSALSGDVEVDYSVDTSLPRFMRWQRDQDSQNQTFSSWTPDKPDPSSFMLPPGTPPCQPPMGDIRKRSFSGPSFLHVDLKRLEAKLVRDYSSEFPDVQAAAAAIEEYKRFVHLKQVVADAVLAPSPKVDKVWHEHILDTRAYAKDCKVYLGSFFHHQPSFPHDATPAERQSMLQHYATTLQLYKRVYGQPAPQSLWPPASEEGKGGTCCSSNCVRPMCKGCIGCRAVFCVNP